MKFKNLSYVNRYINLGKVFSNLQKLDCKGNRKNPKNNKKKKFKNT